MATAPSSSRPPPSTSCSVRTPPPLCRTGGKIGKGRPCDVAFAAAVVRHTARWPPPMSFFAEYNVSFNQECWPARGATFPTDLTVPLTSPIECMTPSLVGK